MDYYSFMLVADLMLCLFFNKYQLLLYTLTFSTLSLGLKFNVKCIQANSRYHELARIHLPLNSFLSLFLSYQRIGNYTYAIITA